MRPVDTCSIIYQGLVDVSIFPILPVPIRTPIPFTFVPCFLCTESRIFGYEKESAHYISPTAIHSFLHSRLATKTFITKHDEYLIVRLEWNISNQHLERD